LNSNHKRVQVSRTEHIAIVGAGTMGHGIAQVFASKGHEVVLTDLTEAILHKAYDAIEHNLALLARHGVGAQEDIVNTLKSIRFTTNLTDAVKGARFIIETVKEDLELKKGLFREIESVCSPYTVIATTTSTISLTEIASAFSRKERLISTHFWNPPYLVPLVEVAGTTDTAGEVVEYVIDLLKTAGKHPVHVKKNVPGSVGNRLQHALWREAMSIVEQGIADASAVDEIIKNSFGLRLGTLGPLENADMVGLDLTLWIHDYILPYLERSTKPSKLLKEKVAKGDVGMKTLNGFYEWDHEKVQRAHERIMAHLIGHAKEAASQEE
jgi:3-hydroxybutyryl-CoA dehydrogenase